MFTRRQPASPDSASTSTAQAAPSSQQPPQNGKDVEELRRRAEVATAELDRLRQDNERLQELVNSKHNQGVSICGYLAKWRPFAGGLMSQTWEPRFFTLNGSALQYYKSETDTAKHPRGHIEVQGCIVEYEGVKKQKHYTFGVVDRAGQSLIRVSSTMQGDVQRWITALQTAGCELRTISTNARSRSPLRPTDVRWGHSASGSAAGIQPQLSAGNNAGLRSRWNGAASKHERMPPDAAPLDYNSESAASESGVLRVPLRHEIQQNKRSPMIASSPMHQITRASLLSSERIATQQQSGLLMLGCVILVATNSRLILENLLKYGLLYNPVAFLKAAIPPIGNLPLLSCWPALLLSACLALGIEQLGAVRLHFEKKAVKSRSNKDMSPSLAKRKRQAMARLTEGAMFFMNLLNTSAVLLVPSAVITWTQADPLPSAALTMLAVILWMKLVSYAHCNCDLRSARREGGLRAGERGTPEAEMPGVEQPLLYPENLTVGNITYFIFAPTLVYQLAYPRSSRFRLRWTLWNLAKLGVCLCLMLFLAEQYIEPTIRNAVKPMQELNWVILVERVLKLAIPTLYIWLVMFYTLFHVWLNILSEVMRFGDREFYKDWWNAVTIGDYWRLWNMPVHKWMLRHVYYPAMRAGIPKYASGVLVFFVSAVFHELLVGLPLHMVKAWSFIGIMSQSMCLNIQVPLMYITEFCHKKLKNEYAGNLTFWLSFCIVGQPVACMLYWQSFIGNSI